MLDYGFEKFGAAVYALAASAEGIKKRLRNATDEIGRLREENVPEEMRDEFNNLRERITSGKPQGHEGTLTATVNQISDADAVKLAGDIVLFNDALILWRGRNWGKPPETSEVALASTDVH